MRCDLACTLSVICVAKYSLVGDLGRETTDVFWDPDKLFGIQMKIRLSPSGSVVGPDPCAFVLTGRTIDLACVTQGDLFHEFIE